MNYYLTSYRTIRTIFKTYNVSNGEVLGTSYRSNIFGIQGALSLQLKGDLLLSLISSRDGALLYVYNVTSGILMIIFQQYWS